MLIFLPTIIFFYAAYFFLPIIILMSFYTLFFIIWPLESSKYDYNELFAVKIIQKLQIISNNYGYKFKYINTLFTYQYVYKLYIYTTVYYLYSFHWYHCWVRTDFKMLTSPTSSQILPIIIALFSYDTYYSQN